MSDPFLIVAEIAGMKAQGKTWAQVAEKMGYRDARAAKKAAKMMARQANAAAATRSGRAAAVAENLIAEEMDDG